MQDIYHNLISFGYITPVTNVYWTSTVQQPQFGLTSNAAFAVEPSEFGANVALEAFISSLNFICATSFTY